MIETASVDSVRRPIARVSPYQGLAPYGEADAGFFRGRERERERIIANLIASHLTLLYGPSGVGKTSLLRAGVTRRLQEQAEERLGRTGSPGYAVVVADEWRPDARSAFSVAVWDALTPLLRGRDAPPSDPPLAIDAALDAWADILDADLVVILDQFEEYFVYHASDGVDEPFAAELITAVNRRDLATNFLISIREDAVAKIDRFKGAIPALWENYLRVDHLDRSAAEAAILQPIAEFNRLTARDVQVEPALVKAVLDQVGTGQVFIGQVGRGAVQRRTRETRTERVQTPYLQLVLTRLWDADGATDRLKLATLERLGGAAQIVQAHLDGAMERLPASQRDVAAHVFHFLVTPGGSKIALTVSDLAGFTQFPRERLQEVLSTLSGGDLRILRPTATEPRQEEPSYEVYHDVLCSAVLDWRARYLGAREVAEAQRVEQERAALERRTLLGRLYWAGAGILVAAVVVLAAVAYVAYREGMTAEAQADAARATLALAIEPEEALRLALRSLDTKETPEGVAALRAAVANPALLHLRWENGGQRRHIAAVAMTPDARTLVTGDRAGGIRVSRVGGDDRALEAEIPGGPVLAASFAHAGRRLTTARTDGIEVWNVTTGQRIAARPFRRSIRAAAISAAADRAIVAEPEGRIALVSLDDLKSSSIRPLRQSHAHAVAISADGRVAAADAAHNLLVWNTEDATLLAKIRLGGDAQSISLSRTGDLVAVAVAQQTNARVWDVGSGTVVAELPGAERTRFIIDVELSADGVLAATASDDRTVRIWDVATEELVATLRRHQSRISAVEFGPQDLLITADRAGNVRLWEYALGTLPAHVITHPPGSSVQAAFSTNGELVVTAATGGVARIIDTSTRKVISEVRTPDGDPLLGAAFEPGGRRAAIAGFSSLFVVDATHPSVKPRRMPLRISASGGSSAVFSPDTARVAMADGDQAVLRETTTGSREAAFPASDFVTSLAFSRSGEELVVGDNAGRATIWSADEHRRLAVLRPELRFGRASPITATMFGERDRLLSSDASGLVRVWDWRSLEPPLVLRGHEGPVHDAGFSPDSSSIVTASADGSARLWNAGTGEQLELLLGHEAPVLSARFSDDGQLVLTAGADGTARVWSATDGRSLLVLRGSRAAVTDAWFHPAGASVLMAGADGVARLVACPVFGPTDVLRRIAKAASEAEEKS